MLKKCNRILINNSLDWENYNKKKKYLAFFCHQPAWGWGRFCRWAAWWPVVHWAPCTRNHSRRSPYTAWHWARRVPGPSRTSAGSPTQTPWHPGYCDENLAKMCIYSYYFFLVTRSGLKLDGRLHYTMVAAILRTLRDRRTLPIKFAPAL